MLLDKNIFTNRIKIYFWGEKSGRPRAALGLARVEKREVIPDSAAPKPTSLFLLLNPQYEFGDQTEGRKK